MERAAHGLALNPSLMLIHVDAYSGRVREDLYTLRQGVHRRFLTSIRNFGTEEEWVVYHKQPSSPRACFQLPFSGSLSSLLSAPGYGRVSRGGLNAESVMQYMEREWEYQGLASMVLLDGEDAAAAASTTTSNVDAANHDPATIGRERNVTMLHYRTRNEVVRSGRARAPPSASGMSAYDPPLLSSSAPPLHLYVHPLTLQPLVLTSPHLRVDILSFQAVDDPTAAKRMERVFDVRRASKATCQPFNVNQAKA